MHFINNHNLFNAVLLLVLQLKSHKEESRQIATILRFGFKSQTKLLTFAP